MKLTKHPNFRGKIGSLVFENLVREIRVQVYRKYKSVKHLKNIKGHTLHYLIALQYGISVIGWKILKNKRGGYYIGLFGHYIKNHV